MTDKTPTSSSSHADYLRETDGIISWLFSTDHKRIALLQLLGLAIAGLVGGLLGLALQFEKATPKLTLLSEHTFAASFTMHGAVMLFLLVIPAIPGVIGAFVVPLQLGARNTTFPRLHLLGLQAWTLGAALMLMSVGLGGATSGYTLSVPLSLAADRADLLLAVGMALVAVSMVLRSIVLMTTIISLRARGLFWSKTTPLSWSLLAQGGVTLIAAPVVFLSLLTLVLERWIGLGLFDPAYGGDPLLFQNFFWFGMHALAYSSVVPAIGVVSEVFATLSERGLQQKRSLVVGMIGLSLVSLLSWGVQFPSSGHGVPMMTFFSLTVLLSGVPAALVFLSWLMTIRGGHHYAPPSTFALSAATCLLIGGLFTLPLGALSTAVNLHSTAYEIFQSHLVLSTVVFALLAGLHLWWTKMTGRSYSAGASHFGGAVMMVGVILSFAPQVVLGTSGLPRRMAEYPEAFRLPQLVSLAGTLVLAAGVIVVVSSLIPARHGRRATSDNPWHASGLEWACPSPPPADNFLSSPVVGRAGSSRR